MEVDRMNKSGWHHTEETKRILAEKKLGELNPMYGIRLMGRSNSNWKGGRRVLPSGYILIYKPKHPYCDKDGYIMEHRLVMESIIGRYLKPNEIVHHKNKINDDNRPANLTLFSCHKEHNSMHAILRRRNGKGQFLPMET